MAKVKTSVCEKCRRAGQKLFLKGERCLSPKCSFIRRSYGPGQFGSVPRRTSEFGRQLLEKQKAAAMYGISNQQFKRYYEKASKFLGATDETLIRLLETRLDNVVYRLGLAPSRAAARMLIKDNHILVNGKKVNIPSYSVRTGDKIYFSEKAKKKKTITPASSEIAKFTLPAWLKLDKAKFVGSINHLPKRDEVEVPFDEKLIIEYYTR